MVIVLECATLTYPDEFPCIASYRLEAQVPTPLPGVASFSKGDRSMPEFEPVMLLNTVPDSPTSVTCAWSVGFTTKSVAFWLAIVTVLAFAWTVKQQIATVLAKSALYSVFIAQPPN